MIQTFQHTEGLRHVNKIKVHQENSFPLFTLAGVSGPGLAVDQKKGPYKRHESEHPIS